MDPGSFWLGVGAAFFFMAFLVAGYAVVVWLFTPSKRKVKVRGFVPSQALQIFRESTADSLAVQSELEHFHHAAIKGRTQSALDDVEYFKSKLFTAIGVTGSIADDSAGRVDLRYNPFAVEEHVCLPRRSGSL